MGDVFDYYYVLASKGIQEYIFKGNRLKSAVGGSELIERVPEELVGKILEKSGCKEGTDFIWLSKTAGGARLLLRDESIAGKLTKIIPLAGSLYAPGLSLVQAVVKIKNRDAAGLVDAMNEANRNVLPEMRKILFPSFPNAGPLCLRSPRTGLTAVATGKDGPSDESMCAKLKMLKEGTSRLAKRILPENGQISLPVDISEIVGGESPARVAVVHIDGNGLGRIVVGFLNKLKEKTKDMDQAIRKYSAFCSAIQKATENSLRAALSDLIEEAASSGRRYYPFRPLICAGDDVTIILRSRDALAFAEKFLNNFEENTKKEFSDEKSGLNELFEESDAMLTACAGIAYVSRNYPFYQAYELCESLCSYAKNMTERNCSAIAFWRMTTSKADDFKDDILKRELTVEHKETLVTLSMMPYTTGTKQADSCCPKLEDFNRLTDALKSMPRGSMRQLVNEMFSGKIHAEQAFERVCRVNEQRADKNLKELKGSLARITGEGLFTPAELSNRKDKRVYNYRTPLYDAVQILSEVRTGRAAESDGK